MSAFGSGYNSTARSSLAASQNKREEKQQTFSFPLLKSGEILQCMHELQIPLGEAELMEPEKNKSAIRKAMMNLIELCTGVTREEMSQPAFAGLSALNYPELHEDSIPELSYLRSCSKMMTICGIVDFGLKDITNPNSKRLRRQLSGIINFAKFREERLQMYGELNVQREGIMEKLRQTQEDNGSLHGQLEQLKQQSAGEVKIIEQVEEECAEIETKIGALNKQQAAIRHESGELKKKANDLKDRNATISIAIQEGQADEKKLSSQIVQSPERVKREMSSATERLENERKESLQLERDAQKMKTCAANAGKALKDVAKATTALEEVENEVGKFQNAQEEIRTAQGSLSNHEEKKAEAEMAAKDAERGLNKYEEKTTHLRNAASVKTSQAQSHLLESQTELMKVEKTRRDGMARIQAMESEVRNTETMMDEEEIANAKEVEDMIAQYRKMENVVLEHQKGLMKQLVV
ncbi:hypothetical protein TrCOL_g13779 [Triparma columacea]|uniref:Kinetochore protein NUF2 n=1 Tax=Triparma columacea TaxID=722753 RepID=A0A9W7LC12_9STRA|nr:hypothetical protein TrCOL_g13779 [Triparma columacea]